MVSNPLEDPAVGATAVPSPSPLLSEPILVEAPGHRLGPFQAHPKYQLQRVLGSGSLGTVVLARDRRLARLVAIKFLRESCPLFLARFRREARLTARLAHPAVVKVHELDSFAGRTYLAMEYVDGGSLALARLEPRELLARLRGVVDALTHAHARGIVHRDVKPENVLLDRRGRAYLSDFGLALEPSEGQAQHEARSLAGTPLSMAPEQARGELATPASDQFSLGATLYRQLGGEWPFRGRTVEDVLHAIRHEPVRPLRALAPGVPRRIESLVLRCLEKDPTRRFGSMAELGAELDRLLSRRSAWARAAELFGRRRERAAVRPGPRIHPEELS